MSFYRVDNGLPELVLLHGWPMPKEMFCLVIPLLTKYFNILALDLPGFGGSRQLDEVHTYASMARAVVGLMKTLNITHSNFSGSSMGSRGALEIAYYYPERVDKLSLHAPTVHHWDVMGMPEKLLLKLAENNFGFRFGMYLAMKHAPRLFSQIAFGDVMDKNNAAYLPTIRSIKHSSLRGPYEMLREFVYTDISARLPKISSSTHVFVGSEEQQFHRPAEIVVSRVSSARLTKVVGKHSLAVDNPELFAELVLDGL